MSEVSAAVGANDSPKPPQNLTVSEVFGQATWLMTQSRGHRTILLRQFRLFPGKDQPLGIALWAQLSDEVAKRLEAGSRLKPEEWKSGSNLWLVELLAPFGQQEAMLADLKASVFKGKTFKMHATDKAGQRQVVTMAGDDASGAAPQSTAQETVAADAGDTPKTLN